MGQNFQHSYLSLDPLTPPPSPPGNVVENTTESLKLLLLDEIPL